MGFGTKSNSYLSGNYSEKNILHSNFLLILKISLAGSIEKNETKYMQMLRKFLVMNLFILIFICIKEIVKALLLLKNQIHLISWEEKNLSEYLPYGVHA